MNRSAGPRVFVLDAPLGVPKEVRLLPAGEHAGMLTTAAPGDWPLLAAALRARGAAAVLVTADAAAPDERRHWLDAVHARRWMAPQAGGDIDGDRLPTAWHAQLTQGHMPADAALLAWPALPLLSWGDQPGWQSTPPVLARQTMVPPLGLYAIVDNAAALRSVLKAGVRTVQLRVKRPVDADAAWNEALRETVHNSLAAADGHGARLFINDHWRLAVELGARAVHLGQEDLLALDDAGHAEFRASGLGLGVSSHAVWELCRARSLTPQYIACGPVWPTTTKDMPWRPQGLDNLAWWCRVADAPVVAIGGILTPEQVRQTAAAGASGVCVLRGLGSDPRLTVAALQQAFEQGRQDAQARAGQPVGPLHPTLDSAA
ncbi:MAG: thiamine phosphate synthase [Microbacteriaceae bacterium]|nr:thiamine phosphate synthase [Burkholderiaceae bacterium]